MLTLSMFRRLLVALSTIGLVATLAWESSSAAAAVPRSAIQLAHDF